MESYEKMFVVSVFYFLAAVTNLTLLLCPQVLLRMKENEIEYLHKEITCLRNELQFLNTVQRERESLYEFVCFL